MNSTIIICLVVWYISGVISMIYWHIQEKDFTLHDIFITLLCSILGPILFIVGWCIFTEESKRSIIIRKRKK